MKSINKDTNSVSTIHEAERMGNIQALDMEIREMKGTKTSSSTEIRKKLGL